MPGWAVSSSRLMLRQYAVSCAPTNAYSPILWVCFQVPAATQGFGFANTTSLPRSHFLMRAACLEDAQECCGPHHHDTAPEDCVWPPPRFDATCTMRCKFSPALWHLTQVSVQKLELCREHHLPVSSSGHA